MSENRVHEWCFWSKRMSWETRSPARTSLQICPVFFRVHPDGGGWWWSQTQIWSSTKNDIMARIMYETFIHFPLHCPFQGACPSWPGRGAGFTLGGTLLRGTHSPSHLRWMWVGNTEQPVHIKPAVHVFWLWEETWVPGENPGTDAGHSTTVQN